MAGLLLEPIARRLSGGALARGRVADGPGSGPELFLFSAPRALDATNARALVAGLRRELASMPEGARVVVVDLGATELLDSTALTALLGLARQLATGGDALRLAGARPAVRAMVAALGWTLAMPIHDTLDDALATCAS